MAGHPSGSGFHQDLAQGELLDVIDDVHTDQVGVEAVEGVSYDKLRTLPPLIFSPFLEMILVK
jgi:hypothetical protein